MRRVGNRILETIYISQQIIDHEFCKVRQSWILWILILRPSVEIIDFLISEIFFNETKRSGCQKNGGFTSWIFETFPTLSSYMKTLKMDSHNCVRPSLAGNLHSICWMKTPKVHGRVWNSVHILWRLWQSEETHKINFIRLLLVKMSCKVLQNPKNAIFNNNKCILKVWEWRFGESYIIKT